MGLSVLNSYIKNDAKNELIFISFLMIFVGIILMYFTFKRLGENIKFLAIENYNNFNLVDLRSKLENNFKPTDLHFDEKMGVIIINTQLTGFSWGEVITIILIGNKYLVNSRPNGQPITLYKDRKNVKKISAILRYNN
ncbi:MULTISPECIES: hypothetical protein [unclassified Chryseobacterium]|uniref:hypothetical protein n=1 Tax=unclassified Chryseobacterium TaxID=2593645 RepID=UPI0010398C7F|nr:MULTISPECIES: hypothetical protein [unclassified Chryseobacterium]